MSREVKTRQYDSAGRKVQSDATRERVLEAARRLMIERGYRATTIAAIAVEAAVHVDTVYALVGRKPVLLRELIEQAISGTDRAVEPGERDYVKAIQNESDPVKKLTTYASAVRVIQVRMAPLLLALRDASATEPEAQQVWKSISDRRAKNMRRLAQDLADTGGLRPGLSVEEAADTIWATNSSELYVLFTSERGWPAEQYENWLADTWCRLLLADEFRSKGGQGV